MGRIEKLVADPKRCALYALNTIPGRELVVFDMLARRELTRIALPQTATDLDLSPNGLWLVAAHQAANQLSFVDADQLAVAETVDLQADPEKLEVGDDGTVVYAQSNQWAQVRRLDPDGTDTMIVFQLYQPDLELAPDGLSVFAAEQGSRVYRIVVANGASTYTNFDFYSYRHLLLSGDGQNLYSGYYRFRTSDLALVPGQIGLVHADDGASRWAVTAESVVDTATLTPLVPLGPPYVRAAAFTHQDQELWWFSEDSDYPYERGTMHCANVAGLVGTGR